ncbi:MAG TPA: class I SAM-dependent methyltransferase [Candidatus Sulfotelmatobacter sp.]
MSAKGNYGIDSPLIVGTLCIVGVAGTGVAYLFSSAWRWVGYGAGLYCLLGAAGMLFYSKVGKLTLRERLLDQIQWKGDERVLDVGCGRGLLTVGAARRLLNGKVVGVDVWKRGAITGNLADSVLENAQIEQVSDRVEVKEGDARELPFANETFDVVVSNFVVHEMNSRQQRQAMISEVARVLKPGGQVALVDFVFTGECVVELRKHGVNAARVRDEFVSFWISAILNFGAVRTYHVVGRKI